MSRLTFSLTDENTWETHDGVKTECPKCNRELFIATLIGGYDCRCGATFMDKLRTAVVVE